MDEVSELTRLGGGALAAVFAGAPRLQTKFWDNAALILTGEALAILNIVLIGPQIDAADILVESATISRQNENSLTAMFTPHVAAMLAPHAERLGFVPLGEMPLMVLRRNLTVDRSLTCTVERVSGREAIEQAVTLRTQGRFPIAPITRTVDPAAPAMQDVAIFIGSRNGVPMSTVTVTASEETAGIWWMATPAKYQRLGVGRSLLEQVIVDYQRRGISRFFLGSTGAGRHFYESIHFKTVARYSLWELQH